MAKVGVLGASGYAGAELLRLCASTPGPRRGLRHRRLAGRHLGRPSCTRAWPRPTRDLRVRALRRRTLTDGLDLVFLRPAPRRVTGRSCPTCSTPGRARRRPGRRLPPARRRRSTRTWYGEEHAAPELLADAVYGLPELFRDELAGARLVAAPGCYVTAADARAGAARCGPGLVEPTGIIVDAASGVSGAGRPPKANTDVLHRRRGLHRLRAARPPPHARDRAEL